MSTKRLVHRILSQVPGASFGVRFWDGESARYGVGDEEFVLHLKDEAVCRSLLGNLNVRFGDAYVSGAIEVEGQLERLLRLMCVLGPDAFTLSLPEKLKLALARYRRAGGLAVARRNVTHHYDLGNEFFKLWLGKEMAYSCAYFATPDEDLDTAQERKFRHIAAKLRLRTGARLLDIGCGWGGFLLHAATHHGISGLGVTLSAPQRDEASRRMSAHGVGDRIAVELSDYRELHEPGAFDRIVSIGMFEHVGRAGYPEYFRHTARLLRDGGIGVLHTIGRQVAAPANPWIAKHIFPGAHFPSLAEIAEPLSESGLVVADVEVWRLHYALTLERWLALYEANLDRVRAMYGEPFTRRWRLYLAGCAASFRYGDFCVWQIQFTKGVTDEIPLTRDYLSAAES
jgi:cyclopropane-fatty-acyl-phospholipid synthase